MDCLEELLGGRWEVPKEPDPGALVFLNMGQTWRRGDATCHTTRWFRPFIS
jgi:hypothetical protein